MDNVINVGITTNPIYNFHAEKLIKTLKNLKIQFTDIPFKTKSPSKHGILFTNSSHKGLHMVEFINKWNKHFNIKKKKSFVCLIDNHESKCIYAEKVLAEALSKEQSNKKEAKKDIKELDGERELTNSSEDEELEKTKDESQIIKLDEKLIDYKMFYYIYTEKNLDYKK